MNDENETELIEILRRTAIALEKIELHLKGIIYRGYLDVRIKKDE